MSGKDEKNKIIKTIINISKTLAVEHGDKEIKPEHLLLAIITTDIENNKVIDIFKKCDINTRNLHNDIIIYINSNNFKLNNEYNIVSYDDLTPSDGLIKVLNKSQEIILTNNKNYVCDETTLLLALLSTKTDNNPCIKILENHGLTYNKLNYNIMAFKNEQGDSKSNPRMKKNGSNKTHKQSETPILDKFSKNLNNLVKDKIDAPIIGREKEIESIINILSRKNKANPILIGEAGVGKTAIIEGLAKRINSGLIHKSLLDKQIHLIDVSVLVSGTKYRGEFEARMQDLINECSDNPDIILFMDEIHTMVGAGSTQGSLDAANILKPALARGELKLIGATTLDEFRDNIEKDKALLRRFQKVTINEPSLAETKEILTKAKLSYEAFHNVKYSDGIIDNIIKLTDRYINDRAMPDKALDALDECGAKTKTSIVKDKEVAQLLKYRKELDTIITNKSVVVKSQDYEIAAKLKSEEKLIQSKIDLIKNRKSDTPLEVSEDTLLTVISKSTNIPKDKLDINNTGNVKTLESTLTNKVIGQEDAVKRVVKAIKRSKLGVKRLDKTNGTFLFLGSTGVGKTMLTKELTKEILGTDKALLKLDMSEFSESHTVSKMIGSPAGYVGYGEGAKLTEFVRRNPYSVILFDEIEKAHPLIYNVLLQILDEGRLTDGSGREIDFKNCLIIMTSNVGVKELNRPSLGFGNDESHEDANLRKKKLIEKALKTQFKPELLNRIDEKVYFNSLSKKDINDISKLEIKSFTNRIKNELGISVNITKSLEDVISTEGFSEEYGARPLLRVIQDRLEDSLADLILDNDLKSGSKVTLSYDKKELKVKSTFK